MYYFISVFNLKTIKCIFHILNLFSIRDLNDRTPEFGQAIYVASIPEVGPLNNPVVTVSATDMDMGRNADITYIIDKVQYSIFSCFIMDIMQI